ncbi:Cupredoxin [Aspergillus undulatus]|uniref:Cupredoxin n=1 Tax=Aspergillus undulatus TaxID=1810928 RepID=UPI003CCD4C41
MAIYSKLNLLVILCLIHWVSCRTVRFELNLTWEDQKIAGVVRKVILSNGRLPGPTLRARQGDEVEVRVRNLMPFSSTVHFHGITQMGTPWSDGTPGLSQEPIEPGSRFTYRWTAVDYGSYAYHAHSQGQLLDGLYGAIYIEPKKSVEKPFKLITRNVPKLAAMALAEAKTEPIMLSDWRFLTSEAVWQAELESGCESVCSNAILINGKGSAYCLPQERIDDLTTPGQRLLLGNYTMTDIGCFPPIDSFFGTFPRDPSVLPRGFVEGCIPGDGPEEVVRVDARTRYISRDLISLAGSASLVFSIDEHPMYVYAIDGRYVEPVLVDAIQIPAGSRYSVLVELKQDRPAKDYTIRAAHNGLNQVINGTATLSYMSFWPSQRPSITYITEAGSPATPQTRLLNETLIVPFPVELPSQTVNKTFILNFGHYEAAYRWQLGNGSYPNEYEVTTPALFNPSAIPFPYSVSTYYGTWVDIIFNGTRGNQPPHPMHKHSNKFFVIGRGNEPFHYSSVAEAMEEIPENFNFETPQLRDTFTTPVASGPLGTWLAIRYHVTNPGPFLLHCHLQMHQNGGMALALIDGIDAWPVVPEEYQLSVNVDNRL